MNRVIPKNTAAQSLLAGKLCSYETTNTEKQPIALIHQDARFFLITAGSGEMSVQNRQYPLTANTIVSIMPWQICDIFQINSPLEYQMITYNYDALTRAVKIFSNEEGQTESFLTAMECHSAVTLMPENRTICRLMDMIAKELSISDPNELPSQRAFQNISITSLLVQLLIRFLRLSSELKAEEPHVQTDYTKILRYIYLHCNEKLSLDKLSCRFNCPASDISSYLTDTIGISFSELLNEIRIGKSLNFIMYTDFTLKEMSEFLGYVDESHISKVFAARIGTKISEYRKQFTQEDTMAGMIQGWLDAYKGTHVCSVQIWKEAFDHFEREPKKFETNEICSIMDTQITGWKRDGIHRFSKEGYGRQRSWVREGTEEGGNEPDKDGFTKLTKAEQLELPFDLPDREKG